MLTPEQRSQLLVAKSIGLSKRKAARVAKCSYRQADKVYRSAAQAGPPTLGGPPDLPIRTDESGDNRLVDFQSDRPIRTLDDALAYAEVDTKVWRVDRWECTGWQNAMRLTEYSGPNKKVKETPVTKQLWRVKLYLKRIQPKPFHDATEAVYRRLAERAPVWPSLGGVRLKGDLLCEVDLSDAHFGKLAWKPEVGKDYDLKIAEAMYANAVADILGLILPYAIDRFVLPIGSDFYHVDTIRNTTTAGTPMDADGRYAKIIEAGEMAVINAIERLAAVAPVTVLWIPGNHDRLASYHLARTVAAWFRNTDRVTVDCSPAVRKYLEYGANLIGYTHGDKIKPADLPHVMATEQPVAWAATRCREYHRGHEHRSRVTTTTPVESYRGVVVRTLRAMCYTDAWHHEAGFVGEPAAAECHLYHRAKGYVGHFVSPARD